MHEKLDVIVVNPGESALTSEVFHDDLHHGSKPIQKLNKRKYLLNFIFIWCLEVRFIHMGIQIFSLNHFSTTLGIPVPTAMMSMEMVNVTPAIVTWYFCRLLLKNLVKVG